MVAAWREFDRLAWLDGEPLLNRAHLHDAALHRHFVDLHTARDIGGSADQTVRRVALVFDGEIAASGLRPLRRGVALGLADDEVAGLDIIGMRSCDRKIRGQGGAGDRHQCQFSDLHGVYSLLVFGMFHSTK
jgi:hypothetical protein